jgi:Flp pilus assembly protein TadD
MRTTRLVLLTVACGLLAGPLRADKRVDDAVAKAEEQIAKGRTEDAVKTIQKLVSQPSTEAFTAAARLQVRLGKIEEAHQSATQAVQQAASAAPEAKAAAFATLSQLELLRGTGKDAAAAAQKAVEAQASPVALAALARAQVRTGDAAGAVATAEKAVAAGASSADAHEALGEAKLAAGKAAEAQAAFAKALSLDPKLTAARVGSARALIAQNKAAEAVAEARKATEENPNDGDAFATLGLAHLAQGNWNEAISAAQEGKFKNERNVNVLAAVAKIFEDPKQGNPGQAMATYKAAAAIDPDFSGGKTLIVTTLEREGKYDEAIVEARKLGQGPEAQLLLGRLLLRKQNYVEAVGPLKIAAEAMPSNAEVQAMYGTALVQTKQADDAMEAYKKAVALAPNNVDYQTTYGLVLAMADKNAEAVAALEKVTASPGYKNTNGFTNLGYAYRNRIAELPEGEKAAVANKAVAAYQKALELDAKNAQAALGLGWAASYAKKFDEAIASFAKAIQLEPKMKAEALNGTAWAHYFKKDMAQAKAVAAQAKEAGRNVDGLLKTIDNFEKMGEAAAKAEAEKQFTAQEKGKEEGGLGDLARRLQRGPDKAGAARDMAKFGKAAVEHLIYAVYNDKDFGVRTAAVQSLGTIGDKSVCTNLRNLAANNPYEKTIMTPEEQRLFVAYEDLRKVMRAALAKIGC